MHEDAGGEVQGDEEMSHSKLRVCTMGTGSRLPFGGDAASVTCTPAEEKAVRKWMGSHQVGIAFHRAHFAFHMQEVYKLLRFLVCWSNLFWTTHSELMH